MSEMLSDLERLNAVVARAGKVESDKIIKDVINDLKERSPYGLFDDVAVRHLWDEYCWWREEGPAFGDFEDVITAFMETHLDKRNGDALLCLTAYCSSHLDNSESGEEPSFGTISRDVICSSLLAKVNEIASKRNLYLLGPHRAHELGEYLSDGKVVISGLSEDTAAEILMSHFDLLLDPGEELSELAEELVDAYIDQLEESTDYGEVSELLCEFDREIKLMLINGDALPALEDTRNTLLAELDSE